MSMDIYRYDDSFRKGGLRRIAGIDEAGRGPLAGPVVASAVVLPEGFRAPGLRDSKQVPEKERTRLFYEILYSDAEIGLGVSDVEDIEAFNILGATRLAMKRAVEDLAAPPELLLIDAVKLPDVEIRQECPFKGDSLSASIAAASIVAKVVRDSMMVQYHGIYPEYGFDEHKGYGTRKHLEALRVKGPCPLHRRGFNNVMTLSLPF